MINKAILVGNVGKDPEVRYLESGVAVAQFPLATSETYKDKNGNKTSKTEWHNIVLWRGLAEVAEKYVKKGNPLYIEGRIRTRTYDDKDGNRRYITEINGDVMQMLGSKSSNDNSSAPPPPPKSEDAGSSSNDTANEPLETDDLPF